MEEMSEFMMGWWNCFITVLSDTGINGSDTLKAAGITKEEIDVLLSSDIYIQEKVRKNIIEYMESLKTNKL